MANPLIKQEEIMDKAITNGSVCIGTKNGMQIFVSAEMLAQKGLRECQEIFDIVKRYPVRTDLSGNVVMVEGASWQDAIDRYLNRIKK
jgi:hypothetical protein